MRYLRIWFLPVSLLIVGAAIFVVPLPVFLETPGTLLSLGNCVEVQSDEPEPVAGDYLLTSIHLKRSTTAGVVRAAVADDAGLVPQQNLLSPGQRDAEYFRQQRQIFRTTAQLAAALGLEAAGFAVDTEELSGDGALVVNVLSGTAADGIFRPGDVVTAVNGKTVETDDDLRDRVTSAGDPLQIQFTRDGETQHVEVTPQPMEIGGETRPIIGVEIQTFNARIDLPVPVEVQSGRIGGPSAGLMIALTVYDKASPDVDLAAGRRIAGTGTLSSRGEIGRIGGIALKALSAHRHGADVFLAPTGQVTDARSRLPADTGVEVIGVDSFADAVERLRTPADQAAAGRTREPEPCPLDAAA